MSEHVILVTYHMDCALVCLPTETQSIRIRSEPLMFPRSIPQARPKSLPDSASLR
jgi:hypothetical protein